MYILQKMENICYCDDLTTRHDDAKGCIRSGVNCTAVYPDERSRHLRPSGPFMSLGEAPKNVSVERGVKCSPARRVSVAFPGPAGHWPDGKQFYNPSFPSASIFNCRIAKANLTAFSERNYFSLINSWKLSSSHLLQQFIMVFASSILWVYKQV